MISSTSVVRWENALTWSLPKTLGDVLEPYTASKLTLDARYWVSGKNSDLVRKYYFGK